MESLFLIGVAAILAMGAVIGGATWIVDQLGDRDLEEEL